MDLVGEFIDYQKRMMNGKATWGDKMVEVHGLDDCAHLACDQEAHNQLEEEEAKADEIINQGKASPEIEAVLAKAIQGTSYQDLEKKIGELKGQAKARARLALEHVSALHGILGFCGEESLKKSVLRLACSRYLTKDELNLAVRYAIAAPIGARRYGRRPASNYAIIYGNDISIWASIGEVVFKVGKGEKCSV